MADHLPTQYLHPQPPHEDAAAAVDQMGPLDLHSAPNAPGDQRHAESIDVETNESSSHDHIHHNHDRDSDLGDDSPMSNNDDHSDHEEELRNSVSSDEGVNLASRPNEKHRNGMEYPHSPARVTPDTHLGNHQHPYAVNHPLGMLSSFMGVPNLQSLPNIPNLPSLQHNEMLEKLKMQVRDMKVGFMQGENDFPMHNFNALHGASPSFPIPQNLSSMSNLSAGGVSGGTDTSPSQPQNLTQSTQLGNGFSFTQPSAPHAKEGNPGSNSSTSSETSNSSLQNNGWSFEEQFKQVRQLYEINDDPRRKEFLDELFSFMQKRGSPINRLPIMAKSVLDLYELYNLVIARGGLVDVINKKLWQEIIKGLHLPSSITSAAFTLRTQYMKYLYPYECDKKGLSTPAELQAAIDGNRREGRRSSYGQFDSQMQGQLQAMSHSPGGMQQMSPLSLVTHAANGGNNSNHRLMGVPSLGHMPNPNEYSERMIEYLKMFQNSAKDLRPGSQSPESFSREALEMSRLALWSMSMANTSPPVSINNTSSPPKLEPQREALNLSESPPNHHSSVFIKREREPAEFDDRNDLEHGQPPTKQRLISNPASATPDKSQLYVGHGLHHLHHQSLQQHLQHLDSIQNMSTKSHLNNNSGSHNSGLNHLNHNHHNNNNNHHHHNNKLDESHDEDEHDDDAASDISLNEHNVSADDERMPGAIDRRRMMTPINNRVPSIHHRNPSSGGSTSHLNGTPSSSSTSTGGSPTTIIGGMQFKVTSRTNPTTGDPQLVVTMEMNGIQYEGVLFANNATTATAVSTNEPSISPPPTAVNTTPAGSTAVPIVAISEQNSPTKVSAIQSSMVDDLSNRIVRPLVSP